MSDPIKKINKVIEDLGHEIKPAKKAENVGGKLLGKFEGALPEGKSSTAIIKDLRASGYDKY